jgi:hypothetical protein
VRSSLWEICNENRTLIVYRYARLMLLVLIVFVFMWIVDGRLGMPIADASTKATARLNIMM